MTQSKAMVTIDFWNTLVKAETGGGARREMRINALREVADRYDKELSPEDIDEAKKLASEEFDEIWFNEQRTPTSTELVRTILSHLDLSTTDREKEYLVEQFEESLWVGPPQLADDAGQVISELASRYAIGLISDTMYSPGRVLRKYLEKRGLIDYFDGFVFSDETGYSKPNPKAFSQLLEQSGSSPEYSWHIGDLLMTDIKGAKQSGMNAILFSEFSSPDLHKDVTEEPDHICRSWLEIQKILC